MARDKGNDDSRDRKAVEREAQRKEDDFRAAMEESKRLNEESGGHGPHGTDK